MAKYSSENTKTLKYFRAYLDMWLGTSGLNKTEAAKRAKIAQSQLNEIINGKSGASITILEKICHNLGINIVDALALGRQLSGEFTKNDKFTPYQINAIEAFKEVLLSGGELADELAERAIAIAKKRKMEKGEVPAQEVA